MDSGGQGLIQVLKGTYDGLLGKEIEAPQAVERKPTAEEKASAGAASADLGDIKFGYCTEFIINLEKEFPLEEEHSFKAYLESIGDSIVVVADDEIVKVHVHTNDPGLAIQKALTYGSLSRMKIDNMREEHEEKLIREASRVAAEEKVKEQAAAEAAKASEPRKEAGFRCGIHRRRSGGDLPRTECGLYYRGRTNHESQHGGYAAGSGSCECGYHIYFPE